MENKTSHDQRILRPTILEVHLKEIEKNVLQFKKLLKNLDFMAVVKANAYGLGAIEVSKVAIRCKAKYLCVATIEEGIEIRKAGITNIPILVLGGILPEQFPVCTQYHLNLTISSISFFNKLCTLLEEDSSIDLHLNVDTGMNRIGISPREILSFLSLFERYKKNLKLNGLWTHFPSADSLDSSFSLTQIKKFKEVVEKVKNHIKEPFIIHTANSSAIINLPESYFDMVRLGLGLYGYYDNLDFQDRISLHSVITWKTKLICIKKVNKGESIGYGRTFITAQDSIIGTIPVGYADGYDRLLSNRGFVMVNGKKARVVGRVCMDQTMIDLTGIPNADEETEVVLLGGHGDNSVSIYSLCDLLDTIPNEILVKISQRVSRVYQS